MSTSPRRDFMRGALAAAGIGAAASPAARAQAGNTAAPLLPAYARAQHYRSLKQSSYDRTGGNRDSWPIPAGGVQEVFRAEGAGVISHIWFTIAARSEQSSEGTGAARVLGRQRQAQRRNPDRRFLRPEPGRLSDLRIGVPGLLAREIAQLLFRHALPASAPGSPSPTRASRDVGAFYSNIDYMAVPRCPKTRSTSTRSTGRRAPCTPVTGEAAKLNLLGGSNYVLCRNARPRPPDGRHAGRAAERRRLVGRRRRHDFRRRRNQAADQRHRVGGLLPGELGFRRPRRRAAFRPPDVRRAAHRRTPSAPAAATAATAGTATTR